MKTCQQIVISEILKLLKHSYALFAHGKNAHDTPDKAFFSLFPDHAGLCKGTERKASALDFDIAMDNAILTSGIPAVIENNMLLYGCILPLFLIFILDKIYVCYP